MGAGGWLAMRPGSLPLLLAAAVFDVTISFFVSAWGVAGIMPLLGAGTILSLLAPSIGKAAWAATTGDTGCALVGMTEDPACC